MIIDKHAGSSRNSSFYRINYFFFKKTVSILTISIKKESIEQVVIKHNLKGYFRCISDKDFDR